MKAFKYLIGLKIEQPEGDVEILDGYSAINIYYEKTDREVKYRLPKFMQYAIKSRINYERVLFMNKLKDFMDKENEEKDAGYDGEEEVI
jgi:hypothetical protein